MKNLELTQMESVKGNGPCFNDVACVTIAFTAGFFAPVIGSIAITGACIFLVDCNDGTDAGTEWW